LNRFGIAAFLGVDGIYVFVFVVFGEVKTNFVVAFMLALRTSGAATGSLTIRTMRRDGARSASKTGALTGITFARVVVDVATVFISVAGASAAKADVLANEKSPAINAVLKYVILCSQLSFPMR